MIGLARFMISGVVLSLASFSASNSYQLNNYGINSGGSNSTASSTFSANVSSGEANGAASGATTYTAKSGSIEAQQANVPGAPTLDNGGGGYINKLNFIINTSSNPSDTTYVVEVATDSGFSSPQYVQTDGTLGSTQVFQTYSQWGSGTGTFAIGLNAATTYWFKVAAMQGKFTATAFGPSANATTGNEPTLSFSLSPNTLSFGNLNAGSVTSGPSNLSFTLDTNAAFGATIYVAGSNAGIHSTAAGNTIAVSPPSGDLSSLSEGFGLQGISASSPLSIQSPYNGASDVVGAIYTTFQPIFSSSSSVSSGTATAGLKAKASATTPAAQDYTVTLTFVAAASY